MTALANLLDGLFDYAGLYPPAGLDVASAVENYLAFLQGNDAHALGRFVVDLSRVGAVRDAAGDRFHRVRLSVVATASANWNGLSSWLDGGAPIEAVEMKVAAPSDVDSAARRLPSGLIAYFEVSLDAGSAPLLDAVCASGANVKLRMGGVVAEAFPSAHAVAEGLQAIAERHLAFKATAGLHHPLRSRHAFTYASGSAQGMMHGFVNLCCAAALVHAGGQIGEAAAVLEETDPRAWRVSSEAIAWRDHLWGAEEIRAVRQELFASIGSCSFTEPLADLEALGWR